MLRSADGTSSDLRRNLQRFRPVRPLHAARRRYVLSFTPASVHAHSRPLVRHLSSPHSGNDASQARPSAWVSSNGWEYQAKSEPGVSVSHRKHWVAVRVLRPCIDATHVAAGSVYWERVSNLLFQLASLRDTSHSARLLLSIELRGRAHVMSSHAPASPTVARLSTSCPVRAPDYILFGFSV